MSDPTYKRTSGARNKINQRKHLPVTLMDGSMIDSRCVQYVTAPNGAMVRTRINLPRRRA